MARRKKELGDLADQFNAERLSLGFIFTLSHNSRDWLTTKNENVLSILESHPPLGHKNEIPA
jgi:hypothetical protein